MSDICVVYARRGHPCCICVPSTVWSEPLVAESLRVSESGTRRDVQNYCAAYCCSHFEYLNPTVINCLGWSFCVSRVEVAYNRSCEILKAHPRNRCIARVLCQYKCDRISRCCCVLKFLLPASELGTIHGPWRVGEFCRCRRIANDPEDLVEYGVAGS